MNNLKELTKEQHRNAERSLFVKTLLKKHITPYQYYVYLTNQFLMYSALETAAEDLGIFRGIEEIKREIQIAKDLSELERTYQFSHIEPLAITMKYSRYIQKIREDKDKLLAHIYVRHMGDLSGGQIIKRFVPGSGAHYDFVVEPNELKEKLRMKLHDGMAEEAKLCFQMISEFMLELEKSLGMETTD
jgi:heme oxygenase